METSVKSVTPSVSQISNHEYYNQFDNVDDIHNLLKNKKYNQAVDKIKQLCKAAKQVDFPLNKGGYTRNILSKKDGYWLSFLHWDKDVITPVHGHPDQAFLYAAEGNIEIKNYERKDKKPLAFKDTESLSQGEFTYSHGEMDTFDNAIHQISTTEQSLTLHFYSADPTKGKLFKK
ncbi:MAG: hypothetical protein KAG20_05130 [Cocleimonas sp.]|nr:hypothetical protein [Cocleimonas sp.]